MEDLEPVNFNFLFLSSLWQSQSGLFVIASGLSRLRPNKKYCFKISIDDTAMKIEIKKACSENAEVISVLLSELLREIMEITNKKHFDLSQCDTKKRVKNYLEKDLYYIFLAFDSESDNVIGFIFLSECRALYTEGTFGILPELFVRPEFRSKGVGASLLKIAKEFGISRGWNRFEVTTPPLPYFEGTLKFYEGQGFFVSGGQKMATLL